MLRALVELAEREGLVGDEDFERKRVDFEIHIRRDGAYVALVSRRDADGRGQELSVPRMPDRTSGVAAGFLVENAKYVLAIGGERDFPSRLARCREEYVEVVREACRSGGDPALAAVGRFYDDFHAGRARILEDRPASQWTGSEILVFSVDGFDELVHDRPAVRRLWQVRRAREVAEDAGAGVARCLVTGLVGAPARLHPGVKGTGRIGGQTSGTRLVSFDKPAFQSHGLTQGANAPVCRQAAIAYSTALTWLLSPDPATDRPYRHGVRLGPDSAVVYWTSAPTRTLSFFADLWEGPRKADAEAFFEAPWKGAPPPDLDGERFFAVTLGGNAGRLVVRDWFEATVAQVKRALRQYVDDLAIGNAPRPLAIWQLLAAVDPPGTAAISPDLSSRIFAASLRGTPLPRELLRHALLRFRASPDRKKADSRDRARIALVKATLRGIGRSDPHRPHLKEVTVSLDENNDNAAYNLGRLFAALERAQRNALGGDVNATIRDRYFGTASANPATVFPRLIRLAQHHLSKARAESRDFGIERLVGEIVNRLPPTRFPTVLTLEDQGLFAVGYYHQREAFFASRHAAA